MQTLLGLPGCTGSYAHLDFTVCPAVPSDAYVTLLPCQTAGSNGHLLIVMEASSWLLLGRWQQRSATALRDIHIYMSLLMLQRLASSEAAYGCGLHIPVRGP